MYVDTFDRVVIKKETSRLYSFNLALSLPPSLPLSLSLLLSLCVCVRACVRVCVCVCVVARYFDPIYLDRHRYYVIRRHKACSPAVKTIVCV